VLLIGIAAELRGIKPDLPNQQTCHNAAKYADSTLVVALNPSTQIKKNYVI
jgi:hypothetical protein